jgi:tetratricopeptide (TPR) repeat protein
MEDIDYALMLLEENELAEGRDLLEELLNRDPGNLNILYNLGICYTEMDEHGKAIETLSECIRRYPHYSYAYVGRGIAYSRFGDNEKAKNNYLRAIDIDPSNSIALTQLGCLYGGENDYDKAIEYLEKAFSITPDEQLTVFTLGCTFFYTGKLAKAEKYLKITLELDESNEIASKAKDFLRDIAEIHLKGKGCREDTMIFCLSALQLFIDKTPEQVRQVVFEIDMKVRQGLDINNPDKKYMIESLDGSFTGVQLLSYMYVGFKMIDEIQGIGLDLSEEYKRALELFSKNRPDGFTIQ